MNKDNRLSNVQTFIKCLKYLHSSSPCKIDSLETYNIKKTQEYPKILHFISLNPILISMIRHMTLVLLASRKQTTCFKIKLIYKYV